jgi:hypothetical protein
LRVCASLDAGSKDGNIEVDQQAEWQGRKSQIRHELCLVDWKQTLDRLQLKNDRVVHHDIEDISGVQPHALVHDRQRLLTNERHTQSAELRREANLVRRFKEARTEMPVNLDTSADHTHTELVDRCR